MPLNPDLDAGLNPKTLKRPHPAWQHKRSNHAHTRTPRTRSADIRAHSARRSAAAGCIDRGPGYIKAPRWRGRTSSRREWWPAGRREAQIAGTDHGHQITTGRAPARRARVKHRAAEKALAGSYWRGAGSSRTWPKARMGKARGPRIGDSSSLYATTALSCL